MKQRTLRSHVVQLLGLLGLLGLAWLDWGRILQLAGLSGTWGHSSPTLVTTLTPLTGSGQPSQTGSLSPVSYSWASLSLLLHLSFLHSPLSLSMSNKKGGCGWGLCFVNHRRVYRDTGSLGFEVPALMLWHFFFWCRLSFSFSFFFLCQHLLLSSSPLACALSEGERCKHTLQEKSHAVWLRSFWAMFILIKCTMSCTDSVKGLI